MGKVSWLHLRSLRWSVPAGTRYWLGGPTSLLVSVPVCFESFAFVTLYGLKLVALLFKLELVKLFHRLDLRQDRSRAQLLEHFDLSVLSLDYSPTPKQGTDRNDQSRYGRHESENQLPSSHGRDYGRPRWL